MLLINEAELKKLLPMKDAIEAMKRAFVYHSSGKTHVPVRTGINIGGVGETLFMPASVQMDNGDALGIKIVSVFPNNVKLNLPVVPAQMLLISAVDGTVSAMINGTALTRLRTGAIAGAATDMLARKNVTIGALFGTGGQARSQLEAMMTVRNLKEIRIFDAMNERIEPFVDEMTPMAFSHGVKLVPAWSAGSAVDGAEIITTVTTSLTPVFNGTRVSVGAHINGVGSFTPKMRELDDNLLRSARVYVDNMAAVLAEAGDILIPEARGVYSRHRIIGELGDVITGNKPGREQDTDITVFKTVGFAVLDVVAASEIYERALATGVGREVEF